MALIYPDLGKAVTEAWNEMIKEVPTSFFREQVKNAMGLASESVPIYISYYKEGIPYGTISYKPQSPNDKLKKLSVFLFALGFPGKDGKYQAVLDGLKNMAAIRGDTFVFPPPKDKRISYENIKAEYEKQKGSRPNNSEKQVVLDVKESAGKKASAHDTITSLLAASNGNNHIMGRHNAILIDEGYIKEAIDTVEYPWIRLELGISDLDGGNYREYAFFHTYPSTMSGKPRQFLEATLKAKI